MPENGQTSEFVGDLDELDQIADSPTLPIPVNVPVEIDGPVQVHMVPSIAAGSRSWAGVGSTSQRVANADPRRRSCTVMAIDQNVYVGSTQTEVETGYGALWPKLVPLVLTHQDAVYVRSATATTSVSVVVENWAS